MSLYWGLQWIMLSRITRWPPITNNPCGFRNPVACIDKPHTMHGARHSYSLRCINKQSGCKRPLQFLGSPLARSAICKNWKFRYWQQSKTSKEGTARINKVSGMRPGLAKRIEKVRISTYLESPETDLYIAENASSIDYTDTWSSKRVHWMSKAKFRFGLQPFIHVKIMWNSTL
jgi:hypothetical protein